MRYPCGTSNADFIKNWYNAQPFGAKTSYGYHEGDDFNLKTGGNSDLGQPLYAVADGKIAYYHNASHSSFGFGRHMVLECDTIKGKRWYHYAHCQEITALQKDVKEGEVIGKLGKSGTPIAHLHFAVFKVDPSSLHKGIDSIASTEGSLHASWEKFELVSSTQEPMIDTALTECLKQHTDLVNQLEAEKRKNDALTDQLKNKELENGSLRGDVAEKASALKTVREELSGFIETLATKLTTIADKAQVIGAVDRLISGESDYVKKVRNLEKAYVLLESKKKIEIEALKKSIEELKAANEDQAKHIGTLEVRLINLETGDLKTKSLFDIIKNLFERITKK